MMDAGRPCNALFGLSLNHLHEFVSHAKRGDDELFEALLVVVTHQKLEEVAHVIAEVLVTREETEICVDARCRRVVVPGTEVRT